MLRTLMAGVAALAALLPAYAYAQSESEVTLFSRSRYSGARYTIEGPTQGIRLPFVARSVQIPPGTQWEFCTGNKFTGCRQINQSTPATIMSVRSARPVAPPIAATVTTTVTGSGQSLRGLASEYFVTPDEGGNRIEVEAGTAEAMSRRADEFCRTRGWRSSGHERLQTVSGRAYLADVLCVDTGS